MTSMLLRHSPIAVRTLASRAVSPSTCNATGGSSQETGTDQVFLVWVPSRGGGATGPDDWRGIPGFPGTGTHPGDPPKSTPRRTPPETPPDPEKTKHTLNQDR